MAYPLSRLIKSGLNFLLFLTSGLLMAALIWGIDKGFDVTDEAYYLLGLLPGQEKQSTFAALQFTLFSRVFGWLDGVITFRILSLVMIGLAAVVFSWGYFKLIHRLYHETVLSPLAVGAWFLSGSYFVVPALTLTFSYNVFINAIMLFTGGLAFYALAGYDLPERRWRCRFAWGGIGAALLFALEVKPTAALAMSLILIAGGLVFYLPGWSAFFKNVVLPGLAGAFIALAISYFGLGVVNPILATLSDRFVHPGHQPSELLQALWSDLGIFLGHLELSWGSILTALVCGIWAALFSQEKLKRSPWLPLILCLGLAAAICLASNVLLNAFFRVVRRLPVLHVWTVMLTILFCLVVPELLKKANIRLSPRLTMDRTGVQKIVAGLMLLLLPPAAAFGTNNTLTWEIWIHLTPWMGLLFLLFLELQSNRLLWTVGWVALTFFAIWVWAGWSISYFLQPYRLIQDRLSQTEPLNVRSVHFRGLKVDSDTKAFFESYDAILARSNIQPGTGVISLYDNPGLVYLSDGYSPGDIWYQEPLFWHEAIAGYITTSTLPRKSGLILINQFLPEVITDALSQPEIDFPNAYRQLGRLYDPTRSRDVTIYERRR